ncbi:hypothetical protein CWC03_18280 [Pseudoalteromonas sp. S2755]|nr:hypothetical protein CWC03_18280 [Pseudoalteromonas sp. S2755]
MSKIFIERADSTGGGWPLGFDNLSITSPALALNVVIPIKIKPASLQMSFMLTFLIMSRLNP